MIKWVHGIDNFLDFVLTRGYDEDRDTDSS